VIVTSLLQLRECIFQKLVLTKRREIDVYLSSTTIIVSVERTLSSRLIRHVTISFNLSMVSDFTLATMS